MAQRSNNKVFLALVVALAMAVLLTETVPKGIPKQFKFAATSNSDKKKPCFAVSAEEFRKQTDYISIVFIHTESAHAGALVPVSLHLP